MDEVHEVREVREVPVAVERRRGWGALPLVMFLIGGLAVAAVVVVLMNTHVTISWPGGQVNLGTNPPVASVENTTPAPVTTAQTDTANPAIANELPGTNQTAPADTTATPANPETPPAATPPANPGTTTDNQ